MHSKYLRIHKTLFVNDQLYNQMGKYWITLVICVELITQIINFVPTMAWEDKHSVFISSGLKAGQLKVHCKSFGTITKEDVEYVLEPGKSFGWDFKLRRPWLTDTYYSCNFDWNGKKFDLTVWNVDQYGGTCAADKKTHWAVLEDGFYSRCVGSESVWVKRFAWEGGIHLGPTLDNAH
ncbi:hypothetical protein Cgig2_007906 [Carnegiea gigantea]|uniref:S-protein homolog n=1 Tax=Carnegiea gigantea TaxID=171969 RepID=A0A9Q1KFU9_9CARY|nr:hypothetical protein Cgig2_007906 [Carnegiea gigantea]